MYKYIVGPDQYAKKSDQTVNTFKIPYDYLSIVHYGNWHCAPENGQSFTLKKKVKGKVGQQTQLSEKDIEHINKAYCPGNTYNMSLCPYSNEQL